MRTESPSDITQCSRILLTRNGETVHENLSKHPVFAVLDVPLCRLKLSVLNVVFYIYICCFYRQKTAAIKMIFFCFWLLHRYGSNLTGRSGPKGITGTSTGRVDQPKVRYALPNLSPIGRYLGTSGQKNPKYH